MCVCVYEEVCVCVLLCFFKFSYQLCAAKIISHIEFQRSLIMMMSCVARGRGRGLDVAQAGVTRVQLSPCRPSPEAPVRGRFRCSSLNLRLSCRRSNWETRTCPCTDFGHCPAVQLNVFVRTSARTWSCIRWADRTGWSMCLSCNRNGKRETERGIKIIRVETETRIRKINNCRKFSCGLRS